MGVSIRRPKKCKEIGGERKVSLVLQRRIALTDLGKNGSS